MDIAEEPVSQDWQPYNLSNVPIAQEEPAIADTIDVVQDKEEEQADFISMTMPDDEGESFDAFPPIPESISARSPTFHVLRPPRRIHDAIASCIEQCKRPRSARRHHLRPRQITSRVIDRAYGEEISFPFKGVRLITLCCISANHAESGVGLSLYPTQHLTIRPSAHIRRSTSSPPFFLSHYPASSRFHLLQPRRRRITFLRKMLRLARSSWFRRA